MNTNGIPVIDVGDWVEIIDGPSHFLGEIAEVISADFGSFYHGYVTLAISFTPGHYKTNWRSEQVRLLPRHEERKLAIEVLGEDYFA